MFTNYVQKKKLRTNSPNKEGKRSTLYNLPGKIRLFNGKHYLGWEGKKIEHEITS